jgi:hypothetical protein
LFNEPGTYANFIGLILACRFAAQRRLAQHRVSVRRMELIEGLALLSMLLSFSVFGIVLATAYVLLTGLWRVVRISWAIGLAVGALTLSSVLDDYLFPRFQREDSGFLDRTDFLAALLEREGFAFWIGEGFGISSLASVQFSVNDVSILGSSLYLSGILGTFFIVWLVGLTAWRLRRAPAIVVLAVLCISKVPITALFAWLSLSLLISIPPPARQVQIGNLRRAHRHDFSLR